MNNSFNLKIISLNVRGMNKSIKRRKIFRWLHQQNAHCCFLQETYSSNQTIKQWESEWGGKLFYNHGTNHSKGVMILVNPKHEFELKRCTKDKNGRVLILDAKVDDQHVVLVNIYAPNVTAQQVHFFQELNTTLTDYEEESIVIGGDFNCALTTKDRISVRSHVNKDMTIKEIQQLMTNYSLCDIWREKNPQTQSFTWRDNAFKSQSRLDYFLVSSELGSLTKECDIAFTQFSDHSAVIFNVQSSEHQRRSGPGFWKFNSSLLEDETYVNKIRDNIKLYKEKYKEVEDLGLKWDVIKMELRSFTIFYSKQKAKKERDKEKILITKLNELQQKLDTSRNDHKTIQEFYMLKLKLEKITNKRIKGTILRSKARWYEDGEKNSRYFLNLEKRSSLKKKITKLTLSDGKETEDPTEILEEEKSFYKTLYSSKKVNPDDPGFDIFFNNNLITPLDEDQSKKCEGKLTEEECNQALNHMQSGKTPGSDGFTSEFYKCFWEDIKTEVLASINYGFDKGKLSICQRRGIISLLPKKDKPTNLLNNLRPISLLNTDYKIATKAIARRLENILPFIINPDQTGYIKGRYIGENVRLISDMIKYTTDKNLPGIAIFLDFEKAFDSIEWNFLYKALDKFNFGCELKNWIQILYNDISSCVINNGYASEFFNLQRGVRQGCPLSGMLFVLGIEILARAIKQNTNIEGIKIGTHEIKITQYADDTTLFLKNLNSLKELLHILERFERCSGLKINPTKSEAMWLGKWKNREDTPFNFRWQKDSVYALGIHFSNDDETCEKLNFFSKLNVLENTLNSWKRRKLTLLGRINIVKTLGLSKLIYNASVLPVPKAFCELVNKITFGFIWDNKTPKIKKSTIIGDKGNGGLNMIDFTLMNKALKCIWVKRFNLKSNAAWRIIPDEATYQMGCFNFLLSCKFNAKENKINNLPPFYERVLQYWYDLRENDQCFGSNAKKTIIWNNRDIKVDNKTIFWRTWFDKNITFIDNLLDINSDFLSYDVFSFKYQIQINFLAYCGLVNAIPPEVKKAIKAQENQQNQPAQQVLEPNNLTTKIIHQRLVKQSFSEPTSKQRLVDYGIAPERITDYYKLAFSITREIKLVMFQFKILHNIVFTKSKLFKAKLTNDSSCYLCKSDKQDLTHMLYSCPFVTQFWDLFDNWYRHCTASTIDRSIVKVVYGILEPNNLSRLTNHLLLIAKYYIYCCSIKEEPLSLQTFQALVVNKCEIEKQVATRSNSLKTFYNKWKPVIDANIF